MHSITLIPFEIFWWYLVYIFIRSRQCVSCSRMVSPLAALLSCHPWMNLIGESLCSLTCTFWDILMIFGIHIYQIKMICLTQEWLFPLLPFWVISLAWTLERRACAPTVSYTLWDILLIFGIRTYMSGQDAWKNDCSPLLLFWVISLEWTL